MKSQANRNHRYRMCLGLLLLGWAHISTAEYTLLGTLQSAIDPYQPISNATVSLLLSDGSLSPIATNTDSQGNFILQFDTQTVPPSPYLAVSIEAPLFRPREVNVTLTATNTIALSPVNSFTYFQPVQLNDGIATDTIHEAYLDPNLIHQLMLKTIHPSNSYQELHSLLIYKDGHLVVEEYYTGNNDYIDFEGGIIRKTGTPSQRQWNRTHKHYLASVNKDLTSTLTGIALDQYEQTTTTPIASLLPDYSAYFLDSNKAALNLHHMLTMQLGFTWNEWGSNDLALLWQSDDFTDFLLSRYNNGPQSAWVYNSASPNMLLRGLDHLVDGSIRDWADTHLYSKLGITDYDWQSQPDGYPEGSARMYMRPRDMLKIGITYLNNGVWNNEQIIPTHWVDQVSQVQASSGAGDYSYFFWIRQLLDSTYISADGDGGQYINIFPKENMVIVITQGNYLQWPLYVNQANDMMETYILPAILTPVKLNLQLTVPNLELSWSTELTNHHLYSSTHLTSSTNWLPVTNTPTPQGDSWKITLPTQEPAIYFQLQSP